MGPEEGQVKLAKHKVSFEEAATVMNDPMAATGADQNHSITEDRHITFGVSDRGRCWWSPILRKIECDPNHKCSFGEQRREKDI